MKQSLLFCLLPLLCGCGSDNSEASAVRTEGRVLVLTASARFDSGGLDSFDPDDRDDIAHDLVVAAGDAALRKVGSEAVILNRGTANNLLVLDGTSTPRLQVSLDGCNPHDVEALAGSRALVTCYDKTTMAVVDLQSGEVSAGPDLSLFADGDGLPEMDQLVTLGGRIYVSLQRLDRSQWYAPTGPALLAVIDGETLALVDTDATREGAQAWNLGCENPYSELRVTPDNQIVVACSGNFVVPGGGALVTFDPASGESTELADEYALGGTPTSFLSLDAGVPVLIVAAPNAMSPDHMRVVRVAGATVTQLYASPGFTLSGLAIDELGNVYIGNRTDDENAGVWIAAPTATISGPVRTSLLPVDIAAF